MPGAGRNHGAPPDRAPWRRRILGASSWRSAPRTGASRRTFALVGMGFSGSPAQDRRAATCPGSSAPGQASAASSDAGCWRACGRRFGKPSRARISRDRIASGAVPPGGHRGAGSRWNLATSPAETSAHERGQHAVVAAANRLAFDQQDRAHAGETGANVRTAAPKLTQAGRPRGRREHDVPAHMSFPRQHRTNPIERLNKDVKRRADAVGVFPSAASIMRLIGHPMVARTLGATMACCCSSRTTHGSPRAADGRGLRPDRHGGDRLHPRHNHEGRLIMPAGHAGESHRLDGRDLAGRCHGGDLRPRPCGSPILPLSAQRGAPSR